LNYASLNVSARRYYDTMAVRHAIDPSFSRVPAIDEDSSVQESILDRIPIAAAHAMDGTHSNIFGLMMPYPTAPHAILDDLFQLIRSDAPRAWGLSAFEDGRGWFILGDCPHTSTSKGLVDFATDFSYLGAYVVPVRSTQIGSHRMRTGPKWCIIDTGCAETYLPSSSSDELISLGVPDSEDILTSKETEELPTIEFEFGTEARRVKLVFPNERWTTEVNSHNFRSMIHFNNPNVKRLLGNQPVMILGIAQMKGLHWHFDTSKRQVTVFKL